MNRGFSDEQLDAAIARCRAASDSTGTVGAQLALLGLALEQFEPVIRSIVRDHGESTWTDEDTETACYCVALGLALGLEVGRGGAADDVPVTGDG